MGIKISNLPSGNAEQNSVVPASNASGSSTAKVKLGDIASLATKQTVGLGNVDNTSDINKPVSTAQAAADSAVASAAATDATTKANAAQAYAVQRSNHTGTQPIGTIDGLQAALDAKQSGGNYATLVDGKVPASQLPSYVDDVLEYADLASFPANGETGKIYVALNNSKTYRWSGSAYVEIASSPGNTDAVPEGSVNLYYTDSRASNAAPVQSVAGKTGNISLDKNDFGLGNVDNTSDINKPISNSTQTALDAKAPIDNPTFTGNVSGVTKEMVGLGNVDNTGDMYKPVSIIQQAELDLKAPIENPIFTGNVSGVTKDMVGLGNVDNTSDINKPVSTAQANADIAVQSAAAEDATSKSDSAKNYAIQRSNHTGYQSIETVSGLQDALNGKQPSGNYATIVNGTIPSNQLPSTDSVSEGSTNLYYTDSRASAAAPVQSVAGRGGNVALTKTDVGLSNVDNTSDIDKPVSTAQAIADNAVQSAAASDATTKLNAAQAYAVQRTNHTGTQAINTVDGLQAALDSKLSASDLNTDIVAGGGIGLNYNNVSGSLTIYSTNEAYVTSLGSVSGIVAINYDALTRSIQTLTLNGSTTTLTKGSGWPALSGTSVDVVLKITVSSSTTIVWTIVNEWYNQPTAGALGIGTHLFLLRAVGNSVMEGHYIGIKTN